MSTKRIGATLAAVLAMFAIAACGDDDSGSSSGSSVKPPNDIKPLEKLGAGEGQVDIIAWAGYAEDGSTDPKVDWVTPFEKATGCQTNVTIGNTSDEMVTI